MSTGAKIAIGCGAVVLLAGLAFVVGVVGLGYWAKGKAEGLVADQKQIDTLLQTANANTFTAPDGGLMSEPRLVKFLNVRKQVYAVYEKNKADIEAMGQKKQADFSDLRKGYGVINELRLARAQGLAGEGMSEDEYTFYVSTIYTTMIGAEVSKATGGKSVSEVTEEAMRQAAEAMEKTAEATPDPNLPPEAQQAWRDPQEQLRQQQEELKKQAAETNEQAHKADVPPENIALFQKYDAEIKKYAMSGLEWAGL